MQLLQRRECKTCWSLQSSLGASKPARWLKKLMFIASSEAWTVLPHPADSKPGKELKRQREVRIFTCRQVDSWWRWLLHQHRGSMNSSQSLNTRPSSPLSFDSLTLTSGIKPALAVLAPGEEEIPTGTPPAQKNKCPVLLPSACSRMSCPGDV